MAVVMMRHRVEEYDVWRAVHDSQRDTREAYGVVSDRVFRGDSDSNDLLILFEWDSHQRARLFVRSEDLSDALVRGGVTEPPDIWILTEEDLATY